ncbi:MAG: EscE/YscE/SsaE family type III secretion system needle protein co-chaperone [Simkaniaceae bacterium]
MYGFEKKPNKNFFEFDLEKDLLKSPEKAKQIAETLESKITKIKEELRKGTASEDFDSYGVLLHGYVAMQKVMKRIQNSK